MPASIGLDGFLQRLACEDGFLRKRVFVLLAILSWVGVCDDRSVHIENGNRFKRQLTGGSLFVYIENSVEIFKLACGQVQRSRSGDGV